MNFFKIFNRAKSEPLQVPRINVGYSGGTRVDEDSAMMVSAYYRGVVYLSSQLAKLPIQIKKKDNSQVENDIHYLLNVQPNPETTSYHLKLFLIQCAINLGEGYAEIVKTADGRVKELWPLNPKRVSAVRDSEGTLSYQVYMGGPKADTVYLRPDEILIFRNIHTKDGLQAQGTIAYAMESLGISLGADRFANSLYANGAMPSGVLSHPGSLSDEASKRLAESWKSSVGGRKTGSTAILEEGVTYSPISHSPDILQFVETRKFNVIEIARFLGVPPIKLFDMDSAKYGNMEQVQLEVATDILDAWARNIESEIDVKLLKGRRAGQRCEMDLYAVFRGDMSTRSTYFTKMMQSAAMTPNEIRSREGMAPYDGGDRFFIAVNNFSPMDRLDEVIDKQVEPKESPVEPSNQPDPVSEAIAKYIEKKT
jgi:HK97 family phage portal protein